MDKNKLIEKLNSMVGRYHRTYEEEFGFESCLQEILYFVKNSENQEENEVD